MMSSRMNIKKFSLFLNLYVGFFFSHTTLINHYHYKILLKKKMILYNKYYDTVLFAK